MSEGTKLFILPLFVGFLIFCTGILGTLVRPTNELSVFWIGNSVLLGLMIRWPVFQRPLVWIAASIGYICADLVTGTDIFVAILLYLSNISGVATGVALFRLMPANVQNLQHPLGVLYCFVIMLIASTVSGFVGSLISIYLFRQDLLQAAFFWILSEMVTYLLISPVILAFPAQRNKYHSFRSSIRSNLLRYGGPVFAVLAGTTLALTLGGPGAITYTLPGLIWLAVTYPLHITALFSMATGTLMLLTYAFGYIPNTSPLLSPSEIASIRVGISLLTLGPLTVASLNFGWNALHHKLADAANFDPLTGTRSRRAFMDMGEQIVAAGNDPTPPVVMMVDVDFFKQVNDYFGHAVGDESLKHVGEIMRANMRPDEILGRVGGEEFAIMFRNMGPDAAKERAERIRRQIETSTFKTDDGDQIKLTVSIGVAIYPTATSLRELLLGADGALYTAKQDGRNCVRISRGPSSFIRDQKNQRTHYHI